MNEIILLLHSYLRWVVLILAAIVILRAIKGVMSGSPFTDSDRKPSLFLMISADVQLLLGLILYFNNGWYVFHADTMKIAETRYFSVEHITAMVIAWILVHVGYAKIKKGVGLVKTHKTALIFFGIAILLVLAMIPWGMRPMFR
jgi:hypothetical protein